MSLISIIVPIYNVEQYLDRCLWSIRKQTYSNLEIILVNDGSPDNSHLITDKHAEEDSRIQIINKENGGLSSARNAGIKQATGEYIAFIDSDDWIEHTMFEKLIESIQTHQSDIAVCDVRTEFEDGTLKAYLKQAPDYPDCINTETYKDAFMAFDCFACNKLFKRSLFTEHQILFPEGLLYEDIGTFPRIFFRIQNISLVREHLYHYIVRGGAITQTFSLRGLDYLKVTDIVSKDALSLPTRVFDEYITAFKIMHNFYSLSINCGYIPDKTDRNKAIDTVKAYYKAENWTWKQVKQAERNGVTFYSLRSKAQRIYYRMFWHATPVLKNSIFNISQAKITVYVWNFWNNKSLFN